MNPTFPSFLYGEQTLVCNKPNTHLKSDDTREFSTSLIFPQFINTPLATFSQNSVISLVSIFWIFIGCVTHSFPVYLPGSNQIVRGASETS